MTVHISPQHVPSFQSVFNVPEGRPFLEVFNEEVRNFKEKVSHLSTDELVYYVEDEGDS